MGNSAMCCCEESQLIVHKSHIHKAGRVVSALQKRSTLQVKKGGFSIGTICATNRGNLEDCYVLEEKVLGEGAYGTVNKGECKDTGQLRAIKTISKALVKNAIRFQEEMSIMKVLDHPNIVRLFETFENEDHVFLVLELCTGGELFDCIVDAGKFTEWDAASVVRQMFRAVNYMHLNYIMHRDLKPENWLLADRQEAICKTSLKLIDFGLSKRFTPGEFSSTKAGTPYYVAPEVLAGRYAEKSDVWSIGVIMFILLSGNPPFGGRNTLEILETVRKAKLSYDAKAWKTISLDAKSLLNALLTIDPSVRLEAGVALEHTWFARSAAKTTDEGECLSPTSLEGVTGVLSTLKQFAIMNKLKKATLNVIASQLSDQALRDLKEVFMAMDMNNDGTLSVQELREGLKKAGVSAPPGLARMMEQIDTDGSGVIDYTEFMAATMDKKRYMKQDVCYRAFRVLDTDGSGCLDRQELERLLGVKEAADTIGVEQEIEQIMQEVDLNGDGKIDFNEFMVMMRRIPQNKKRVRKIDENKPYDSPSTAGAFSKSKMQ